MSQDETLEGHLLDQIKNVEKGSHFFWHRIRSWIVFTLIDRYVERKKNRLILDIGAGAGIFAHHLKAFRSDDRYAFIEPIHSVAKSLEQTHGKESNWSHKTLGGEDIAVCLDVLEHISDEQGFLTHYRESLGENTPLILTVPALPFLWSSWDARLGHQRRYTRKSLTNALNAAGFDVLKIHYIFQSMIFPALLRMVSKDSDPEVAEFPSLPIFINQIFTLALKIEYTFFRWLPFGTSLVVVAKKSHL